MQIHHSQNSSTTRRAAFTLIEILVVIAIIALLAAILFPVFSRARESARTKTCASNLRQMGLAFQQYLNDSAQRYPGAAQKQRWAEDGHWIRGEANGTALAADTHPYTYNADKRADVEKGALFPYTKSAQIYVCPSDSDGEKKNLSYSMNCAIAGMHNVRMTRPSEIILLVDEHSANDGFFYTETADSTDHLTTQHNGGGNLLFADGHVKFYSIGQYPLVDSSHPKDDPTATGNNTDAINLKKSVTNIPRFYDLSFGTNGFWAGSAAFGTCAAP